MQPGASIGCLPQPESAATAFPPLISRGTSKRAIDCWHNDPLSAKSWPAPRRRDTPDFKLAMLTTQKTSYDEVPYESFPIPGAHPDRLWTLAHLAGIAAPALDTCRVLELGCAAGGNLIPMAVELPRARFTGLDLSAVQIGQGEETIRALGLTNIKLVTMSVMEVDDAFGEFDYIIAHGLYSWVPADVQAKILQICKRNLVANGVAYVSYNTLPGWRTRGMIRDLMRYHAMQFPEPQTQIAQARSVLELLAKGVPEENSAYGKLLHAETEMLRAAPDYYILHEHLEELNEPIYFHQVVERAQGQGLQYLADADVTSMMGSRFPPQAGEMVRRLAGDAIGQEQLMDFLSNRTFRQTLLIHAEQPIDRVVSAQRAQGLWIATALRPESAKPNLAEGVVEKFCTPSGFCISTPKALTKSALMTLVDRRPAAMAIDDLIAAACSRLNLTVDKQLGAQEFDMLAGDMLHGYAAGVVELHGGPSPFVIEPGARPCASALTRYQAERSARVSTLRHESLVVPEAIRALLGLLDGTRTLEEIAVGIKARGPAVLSKLADRAVLQNAVNDIARNAMLVS
jgi:methyltransferase-like protein/SAM-dependent methyltransferase